MVVVPQTITVRITGDSECRHYNQYRTEYINFKEYVKGVLPNEWLPTWSDESLKVGAIAVKQFGLVDYLQSGFVWSNTCDQVYDPSKRTPQTDKAVDDTWDMWLVTLKPQGSGWWLGFEKTFFNATYGGCYYQDEENCLGQWEANELIEEGQGFEEVLLKFYGGTLVDIPPLEKEENYTR